MDSQLRTSIHQAELRSEPQPLRQSLLDMNVPTVHTIVVSSCTSAQFSHMSVPILDRLSNHGRIAAARLNSVSLSETRFEEQSEDIDSGHDADHGLFYREIKFGAAGEALDIDKDASGSYSLSIKPSSTDDYEPTIGAEISKTSDTSVLGVPVPVRVGVTCLVCFKSFNNSSALAKHKLTHSDQRRYVCNVCTKTFKRQDHLTGHMLTHSAKKPFECNADGCDKSYSDARSLRRHLEYIHNIVTSPASPLQRRPSLVDKVGLESPVKSPDINTMNSIAILPSSSIEFTIAKGNTANTSEPVLKQFGFGSQSVMQSQASIHKIVQLDCSLKSSLIEDDLEQKCELCGRVFKNLQSLNGHMRLHGGYTKKDRSPTTPTSSVAPPLLPAFPQSPVLRNTPPVSLQPQTHSSSSQSRQLSIIATLLNAGRIAIPKLPLSNSVSSVSSNILMLPVEGLQSRAALMSTPDTNSTTLLPITMRAPDVAVLSHSNNAQSYTSTVIQPGSDLESSGWLSALMQKVQAAPVAAGYNNTELQQHSVSDEAHKVAPKRLILDNLLSCPMLGDKVGCADTAQAPSELIASTGTLTSASSGGRFLVPANILQTSPVITSPRLTKSLPSKSIYQVTSALQQDQSQQLLQQLRQLQQQQHLQQQHLKPSTLQQTPSSTTGQGFQLRINQPTVPEANAQFHNVLPPKSPNVLTLQLQPFADEHAIRTSAQNTNNAPIVNPAPVTLSGTAIQDLLPGLTLLQRLRLIENETRARNEAAQRVIASQIESIVKSSDAVSVGLEHTENRSSVNLSTLSQLNFSNVTPGGEEHWLSLTPENKMVQLKIDTAGGPAPPDDSQNELKMLLGREIRPLRKRRWTCADVCQALTSSNSSLPVLAVNDLYEFLQTPLSSDDIVSSTKDLEKRRSVCLSMPALDREELLQGGSACDHTDNIAANQATSSKSSSLTEFQNPTIVPRSGFAKFKRKHRPGPLIIAPPTFRFQSQLRSPRIIMDGNARGPNACLTQYTPPPMLSPMRRGSGLFCNVSLTTPQSAPVEYFLLGQLRRNSISSCALPALSPEAVFDKDTAVEVEKPPETDISPHINVGLEFQAQIPDYLGDRMETIYCESREDLLWHPDSGKKVTSDDLVSFLDFACSAAIPFNGMNKEYALHLLHLNNGNIKKTALKLMQRCVRIPVNHPLNSFVYHESDRWSSAEIESFQQSLARYGKDFFNVSKQLVSKSTRQCIQIYYLWKKICSEEHKRQRIMRRKKEQDILYNLRSSARNTQETVTTADQSDAESQGFDSSATVVMSTNSYTVSNPFLSGIHTTTAPTAIHDFASMDDVVGEVPMPLISAISDGLDFYVDTAIDHTFDSDYATELQCEVIVRTEEFPCKICGKVFFKVKSRSAHMKSHRQIDKPTADKHPDT